MKQIMSNPTLWLVLAIIATIGVAFEAIRWWRGARDPHVSATTTKRRRNVTIIGAIIAAILWVLYAYPNVGDIFTRSSPATPTCTCTVRCVDGTVNADCEVCSAEGADLAGCFGQIAAPAPEPEEYLDAVSLTEDQIADFLSRYSLGFTKRSLAGVNREQRYATVARYMVANKQTPFTECVNYPIATWFPEFDQLLNKELTADERLELQEKFFAALDQEMISNVPFGIMVLEGMKEIPYIYQNNAEWIDGNLAVIDSFYDGTYKQDLASDVELSHIPTLDSTKFKGLDYLVVNQPTGLESGLMVREEWARLVARMSSAMRCYQLRMSGNMVVARTTTVSWRDCSTAESSLVRMVKDDQSESLDVVVLSGIAKSGTERTLVGFNRYDSRLEIFTPGTPDQPAPAPEPAKPEPTKPAPTKPTPQPEQPTPQSTTYNVYRIGVKNDGTVLYEKERVASPEVGEPQTVNGWTPNGYNLIGVHISNVGDVAVSNSVEVNSDKKQDIVVTFTYQLVPARVAEYTLYGQWRYKDDRGNWQILKGDTELGRYAAGAPYDYKNEYKFDGFRVKDSSKRATGRMPEKDLVVYFEYERVMYKLYGEYGYYDGNNNWRTLQNKKLLGEYAYDEQYTHDAPATLTKNGVTYSVTNSPISGRMPNENYVVRFVYESNQHALYARYGYYDSNNSWVDLGKSSGEFLGNYNLGQYYKHYPKNFKGYSPIEPYLDGKMPNYDYTLWFVYVKGNDGQGVKNPLEDPAHTEDAPIGGGENRPTDGPGDRQDTKPTETDYPPSNGGGNSNNGTPSNNTVTADQGNQTHEGNSSGTGGQDHTVVDPNGGYTDNSTPPDTDTPIGTDTSTSGTVTSTNNGGSGGVPTTPSGGNSTSGGSNTPAQTGNTVNTENTTPVTGTVDPGW